MNQPYDDHPRCSKCGKGLSADWEQRACYLKLEIGIDCCSTQVLWGDDYKKIGFNHQAMRKDSGYQRVFLESRTDGAYRLCWHCHRRFVEMVGDFLKTKGSPVHSIQTAQAQPPMTTANAPNRKLRKIGG